MKSKLIVLVFVIINLLIVWAFVSFPDKPAQIVVVQPTLAPTSFPTPAIVSSDKLFQLVNEWRVQNGYKAYIYSEFAESIATKRMNEVQENFTHDKFLSDAKAGVYCYDCYLGENLIKGYFPEEKELKSWLNSPSHRANLERPYTHSAIVCSNTAENYCVHIFSYF